MVILERCISVSIFGYNGDEGSKRCSRETICMAISLSGSMLHFVFESGKFLQPTAGYCIRIFFTVESLEGTLICNFCEFLSKQVIFDVV